MKPIRLRNPLVRITLLIVFILYLVISKKDAATIKKIGFSWVVFMGLSLVKICYPYYFQRQTS